MIPKSADGGTNTGPTSRRLSVVIAAYDERENIEPLTRRLEATMEGLGEWELLYVIEGKDGTLAIAERLAEEIPNIRILYEETPRGLGRAFRRGFAAVSPRSDCIITMDADLNHQPEEIPRLLRALEDRNADILVGSRFVSGGLAEGTPAWKLALSGTFNIILRILFRLRTKDKTSGFRIYRAAALRALTFENDNFAFLPELLIKARASGLRIVEEPIHFIFRRHGTSKMHLLTTTFSYLALLRLRFRGRGDPRALIPWRRKR
jgi:dolichol-phosphate mannosyltransferase